MPVIVRATLLSAWSASKVGAISLAALFTIANLAFGVYEVAEGHANIAELPGVAVCPSCQSVAIGVVDPDPKSKAKSARLVPHEGRIAIVTDAGRDVVDAGGAADESADLCGR